MKSMTPKVKQPGEMIAFHGFGEKLRYGDLCFRWTTKTCSEGLTVYCRTVESIQEWLLLLNSYRLSEGNQYDNFQSLGMTQLPHQATSDPTGPHRTSCSTENIICLCDITHHHNFLKRDTMLPYDTRCYFNVQSKADMSQLNLQHGINN